MLEKCVLTILEFNWNRRLGHKKTKLNICHHMFTSSTHLQKNENVYKMSKHEKGTCKACKNTVFHCQICKFVGFLLRSSSWLLKLPTNTLSRRFQIYPLWRAFSKSSVFAHRKHRFSVDGGPIRIKKVAFSNLSGLV